MNAEAADKLMRARCKLMTKEPWYGHMAMRFEYVESEMDHIKEPGDRSCGVKFDAMGSIKFLYYPGWVLRKSVEQLYGAIEEVINHLVRLHNYRRKARDKDVWNIATDMVVHGKADKPNIGFKTDKGHILPEDNMIFVPEDWSDDDSAESYYDKLGGMANGKDKNPSNMKGKGKGKGNGKNDKDTDKDGAGSPDGNGTPNKMVDNHDLWDNNDIGEEEARQVMNNLAQDASAKSIGNVPGHLKSALEALKKPIVYWRSELKKYVGTHIGNRRSTYSRADRRTQTFGVKGVSHHAAAKVSVIVDLSGSVSEEEKKQFFGEIDMMTGSAKINVLQWDYAFQAFHPYRKGDWKRIILHGGGGTDMAAPVKWLHDNKAVGDVCIMFTDGECNWPEQYNFPMVFVIANKPSFNNFPKWGKVIKIDT